jgi:hypothetical protein
MDLERWERLGPIYSAGGETPWQTSHAFVPTPLVMEDGRVRVYVAFLDVGKRGRLGYVDVAGDDPTRILAVSRAPCLDLGEPGCFDEDGITPLHCVRAGGILHMFYAGWQRIESIRYLIFMGHATSRDGGETFQRSRTVPLLERRDGETIIRTAGFVMPDGQGWRMWYAGGSATVEVGGKTLPAYVIRHMRSGSLDRWEEQSVVCMQAEAEVEYGFGRPWVIKERGVYRMWPSVRRFDTGYRIEYAESLDGIAWTRNRQAGGLYPGGSGWDGDHTTFAAIVDTAAGRFMFYNGNNYGETGFGAAVATRG